MNQKIRVGVLGGTGMVGQQYIQLLHNHPWFEVSYIAASSASAGKTYAEAVSGRWFARGDIPEPAKSITVCSIDQLERCKKSCEFVFSALDTAVAHEWEETYAGAGIPVVSNASAHRNTPDVPMIIPEINPEHLRMIAIQKKNRGWDRGFIVVKPNCSIQSYVAPLYVLHKMHRLKKVCVTTMQSISGAGHPGVSSYDILDNIIPFIGGEEQKSEQEPKKIFATMGSSGFVHDESFVISAHCNRVPTIDGHMACVSFECEKRPDREEILTAWRGFSGAPQELNLPLAPRNPILYRTEDNRPQTRLDRDTDKGMAVTVGRLREDPVLQWKFVGLSHNTLRGAAGGGVLIAELLHAQKFI